MSNPKRCDFRLTTFHEKHEIFGKKRYKEFTYTRPVCIHCNKFLNDKIQGAKAVYRPNEVRR